MIDLEERIERLEQQIESLDEKLFGRDTYLLDGGQGSFLGEIQEINIQQERIEIELSKKIEKINQQLNTPNPLTYKQVVERSITTHQTIINLTNEILNLKKGISATITMLLHLIQEDENVGIIINKLKELDKELGTSLPKSVNDNEKDLITEVLSEPDMDEREATLVSCDLKCSEPTNPIFKFCPWNETNTFCLLHNEDKPHIEFCKKCLKEFYITPEKYQYDLDAQRKERSELQETAVDRHVQYLCKTYDLVKKSELVADLYAKWDYLTNHMYEMKYEPDFEKETEKIFIGLIEKYEVVPK